MPSRPRTCTLYIQVKVKLVILQTYSNVTPASTQRHFGVGQKRLSDDGERHKGWGHPPPRGPQRTHTCANQSGACCRALSPACPRAITGQLPVPVLGPSTFFSRCNLRAGRPIKGTTPPDQRLRGRVVGAADCLSGNALCLQFLSVARPKESHCTPGCHSSLACALSLSAA